jgi:hypothetical protein
MSADESSGTYDADAKTRRKVRRKPQGSVIFAFVGTLVLGGVITLITWAAPVVTIELAVVDGQPQARIDTAIWLWFPWKTELVRPLTGVRSETKRGEKLHKRPGDGIPPEKRAVDQGQLFLKSGEAETRVLVSTTWMASQQEQVETFLRTRDAKPVRIRAVGQFIAAYIVPLCLLPFFALFAIGFVGGTIQWVIYALSPGEGDANASA